MSRSRSARKRSMEDTSVGRKLVQVGKARCSMFIIPALGRRDRPIRGGLWDSWFNRLLEFQANDIFCLKIGKRWMWMVPEIPSTQRFMYMHVRPHTH